VGDIVLIHDDSTPPTKWQLGRILKLHVGTDQKVRVVTMKTQTGEIKRSIVKIFKLPIH
jgi:hypothetical protein